MQLRKIDDRFAVSTQVDPADITELARQGYVGIVNNRPDGEEAGQPAGDAVQMAAEASGMAYAAIPVTHAGFSHPQIDAFRAAIDAADGPVIAFCRSGTRSCNLWALAEAKGGGDVAEIVRKAGNAGYNLAAIRPTLEALSSGA